MLGSTLSHYRIDKVLGEGGMGLVYRAFDCRLERHVAVKVLRADRRPSPEQRERFYREARAASALNHPNIVTVHDIDSDGGVDFIVMEFIEGETLDKLIARGALPESETVRVAGFVAGALARAHAAGIRSEERRVG